MPVMNVEAGAYRRIRQAVDAAANARGLQPPPDAQLTLDFRYERGLAVLYRGRVLTTIDWPTAGAWQ